MLKVAVGGFRSWSGCSLTVSYLGAGSGLNPPEIKAERATCILFGV